MMFKKNKYYLIALILLLLLFTTYLFSYFEWFKLENIEHNILFYQTTYKLILGLIFISIMIQFGYSFYSFKCSKSNFLLVIVPGILIAINNFPISAYMNNRYVFTDSTIIIFLVVLFTFATAFLEEIVFRSVILTSLLQMVEPTRKNIFFMVLLSSFLFGIMHFINLFEGASFGATILQVGYSFLMGCLWAVVFLKTKSIWGSIILHFLYNFFGSILYMSGFVMNRYDSITIITTVMVGVLGVVYYIHIFNTLVLKEVGVTFKMKNSDYDD